MKQVISLHGIWSRGKWQEDTARGLQPFFECVTIKYTEYVWLGAIKLIASPWTLGIQVGLFLWYGVRGNPLALVALIAVSVLGNLLARRGLEKLIRRLKVRIDGLLAGERRPHVVAHSLGTYCAGQLLKNWSNVHLDHLVLTGCVLPREYPWSTLRSRPLRPFEQVRNEVGKRDIVPTLAALASRLRLASGFGSAGVHGFIGPSDLIHNVSHPDTFCARCLRIALDPLVHNVFHSGLAHDGVLVGEGHSGSYWLPFFWNLDPAEFRLFVRLATCGVEFLSSGDDLRAGIVDELFRSRLWNWTGGIQIDAFIRAQIRGKLAVEEPGILSFPSAIDEILAIALVRLWVVVAEASESRHDHETDRRKVDCFNPTIAVRQAVAEGVIMWKLKRL